MTSEPSAAPVPPFPRVCMLLESYYPVVGGMETQARNVAGSLAARGAQVFLVTRRPRADLAREEAVDGIPVVRVGPLGASSRLRWALCLTCLPTLWRRRRAYDLIFVPGLRALGLPAVIMSRLLGKRCVLKAESSGELSGAFFTGGFEKAKMKPGAWPARLLVRLRNAVLTRADAFMSLSSEQTEEFTGVGVPMDRIAVVPQSVNVDRFHPIGPEEKAALRVRLNLPANHKIVIFTGRLVSYKGVPRLLNVWEKLAAARPDITLLLVGAGGVDIFNCEDEARRFVRERGLEGRVRFTGAVNNVDEYLQAADLYAFPTENEAFPLALLEAMACGLAAVTTTTGGLKDIVADDDNGLLMRAGNEDDLRRGLERLLDDDALRARIAAAAYRTVQERYTLARVTDLTLALFQRVCAAGRACPGVGR